MNKKIDLTGMRFARLTVTEEASRSATGLTRWHCTCDCGGVTIATTSNLIRGNTNSCGCYRADRRLESATTHGMSRTRLNNIWLGMKQRCNSPNADNYKYYGGRGIRYHPSFETFEGFLAGIPDGYTDEMTLDRIDNDGDYAPGNLRWRTQLQQMHNLRSRLDDELVREIKRALWTMSVSDVSRWYDVPLTTVRRIKDQDRYYDINE